jgi:hypothetical protein
MDVKQELNYNCNTVHRKGKDYFMQSTGLGSDLHAKFQELHMHICVSMNYPSF